ncbi:MAG: DegV family protein [Lachnospiraceae bacterium]|nr:DegV family protein [Lachnospiraceae bacterium]
MKKTAVVTDTNSGLTVEQAKELGVFVLSMPYIINDETYYEGQDMTMSEFFEQLTNKDNQVFTSQPTPESVMNLWDEVLKEYDEIVYIPMSSGLSSSYQTARMLSGEDEYEGKVFVVNNQRISVTMRQSVIDAIELIKLGKGAEEIRDILEEEKLESSIYIMVDTLVYLKKGGRITPVAAMLGEMIKLKPVLQIQGDKLDAFAKARTVKQAKQIMMDAIKKDIETRFGGADNVHICVAHTDNEENAEQFKNELLEIFPDNDIYLDRLPISISVHIGPGSLAVACSKHIN